MSHKKAIFDLEILEKGNLSEKLAIRIKRAGINGLNISLLEGWINEDIKYIREALDFLKKIT
jgi:hypothetical protein